MDSTQKRLERAVRDLGFSLERLRRITAEVETSPEAFDLDGVVVPALSDSVRLP